MVVSAPDSLAQRRDRGALEEIIALHSDPDEEVRWHVALALHALGGDEAAKTLAHMAKCDESPLVREAAAGEF